MWGWLKRFASTDTQQKPGALEQAFLAQSKALTDTQKRLLELCVKQQETLDRIVASRFDRPVFAPQIVTPDPPPMAMLFDDVGEGISKLSVESDAEFLGEK